MVSAGPWGSEGGGAFAHFMPAGNHSARVFTNGIELGSFDFASLPRETTDVDIGSTPAGSFVSVDLSGGIEQIGGLDVTFAEVLTSGQTTVVESGFGPPPPSGCRILGIADEGGQPRYWDLQTSAVYSGLITVCFHYDPAEVRGTESSLRLVDDAGSGFVDITTSLDTVDDRVCGVTSSLSPFAIVEPVTTTNVSAMDVRAQRSGWFRKRVEVVARFTNSGSTTLPVLRARLFLDLNADGTWSPREPARSITIMTSKRATRATTARTSKCGVND